MQLQTSNTKANPGQSPDSLTLPVFSESPVSSSSVSFAPRPSSPAAASWGLLPESPAADAAAGVGIGPACIKETAGFAGFSTAATWKTDFRFLGFEFNRQQREAAAAQQRLREALEKQA